MMVDNSEEPACPPKMQSEVDATRVVPHRFGSSYASIILEIIVLLLIFFAYAGDAAPMVNESHYLVKAKSYWNPEWCNNDPFVSSGKAHLTFYYTVGWLTKFFSLDATAWIGRLFGWTLIAGGLVHLTRNLFGKPFLSAPLSILWIAGIQYGNLAGEWVIGGIEAKVPAYGFVLFGIAAMVKRQWDQSWIFFGIASAFHVLTGGWSVVAGLFVWMITERSRPDRTGLFRWPLILGGLIALTGLIPALSLQAGVDPQEGQRAARIYTFYRLPHHLVPSSFQVSWYMRHALLITATMMLAIKTPQTKRLNRLAYYAGGAFGIACIGFCIGMTIEFNPNVTAKLLRYYWFRLSDAMIPLIFACLMTSLLLSKNRNHLRFARITLVLATLVTSQDVIQRIRLGVPPAVSNRVLGFEPDATIESQQKAHHDWIEVCNWARRPSPSDELFITPRHQQTFKWYADRAELANWKDVPQDASSLIKWHQTFQELYPQRLGNNRVTIQYPTLRKYREQFGVRWMIVDRRIVGEHLPLVRVYPSKDETNDTYAIYELPVSQGSTSQ